MDKSVLLDMDDVTAIFAAERAAAEAWIKRFGGKRKAVLDERIDAHEVTVSKKARHIAEFENCNAQTSKTLEQTKPVEQIHKPASPPPIKSSDASECVLADLIYDDVAEETESGSEFGECELCAPDAVVLTGA